MKAIWNFEREVSCGLTRKSRFYFLPSLSFSFGLIFLPVFPVFPVSFLSAKQFSIFHLKTPFQPLALWEL